MNDKQKRFCELFAASGNATDAAKNAGYSERTAYSQGNRLLKNVECAKYIKELQDQAAAERIADISEVKRTWTEILRDKELKPGNRIRAGELLARSSGEMLPGAESAATENAKDHTELEREYIDVALPMTNGSGDFNAIQTENGDIVPLQGHEANGVFIYMPFDILKTAIELSAECIEANETDEIEVAEMKE